MKLRNKPLFLNVSLLTVVLACLWRQVGATVSSTNNLLIEICHDVNDSSRVVRKLYYTSGNLKEVASFLNNKRDGNTIRYNPDGSLNNEFSFKEGMLDGETVYYSKGRKTIEAHFLAGKLDGWYYDFYRNGQINHKAFYERGELISRESKYTNKGKLKKSLIRVANSTSFLETHYGENEDEVTKSKIVRKSPAAYKILKPELL